MKGCCLNWPSILFKFHVVYITLWKYLVFGYWEWDNLSVTLSLILKLRCWKEMKLKGGLWSDILEFELDLSVSCFQLNTFHFSFLLFLKEKIILQIGPSYSSGLSGRKEEILNEKRDPIQWFQKDWTRMWTGGLYLWIF